MRSQRDWQENSEERYAEAKLQRENAHRLFKLIDRKLQEAAERGPG